MNQLTIEVNGTEKQLKVKEFQGQRVVTFSEIDDMHERPRYTASRNFSQNKKHFIEGEDYYWLSPQQIKNTNIVDYNSPKGLTLLTESGYLMLVKSFQDDLAWQVQRKLVKDYFRQKEQKLDISQLSPELQFMNSVVQQMNNQALENKRTREIAESATKKADNISQILSVTSDDWRDKVTAILRKIAQKWDGVEPYRSVIKLSYDRFEKRANCKLDLRLNNRKERALAQGMTKTYIKKINKLDVIAEDKRLLEIYLQVVKEMAIQFQIDINDFQFEGAI